MKVRTKSIKQNLTIIENSRPRKKSQAKNENKQKINNRTFVDPPKSINKENNEAKKYLQKTLNILSHRFNIIPNETLNPPNNILNLSTSVYKIVKQNFSIAKKNQFDNKENICANKMGSCTLVKKQSQSNIRGESIQDSAPKSSSIKNKNESKKIILSQKEVSKPRASSVIANSSILEASSICQQSSIIAQPNVPESENSIFLKRRSNSTLDSYFREKFGSTAEDEEAVEKKLRVIKALKRSQQIVSKSNRSHVQSSMALTNCDINEKSIVMEKLRNKHSQKIR